MPIAHLHLPGLDAERLVAVVEPVLVAHGVEGVELLWRTDRDGRVLELTIEVPGTRRTGEGITVDLCSEISRDLSAALDVADVIAAARYRLEVGSPGVERALYLASDWARFAGQLGRVRLVAPLPGSGPGGGQKVLRGRLLGPDDEGRVGLEDDWGRATFGLSEVSDAHLVLEWAAPAKPGKGSRPGKATSRRASGARPSRAAATTVDPVGVTTDGSADGEGSDGGEKARRTPRSE